MLLVQLNETAMRKGKAMREDVRWMIRAFVLLMVVVATLVFWHSPWMLVVGLPASLGSLGCSIKSIASSPEADDHAA